MHLIAGQEKYLSAALLMRRAAAALQQLCRQIVEKAAAFKVSCYNRARELIPALTILATSV